MGVGLGEQIWHSGYPVLPMTGVRATCILIYWREVCEDSGEELGQQPGRRKSGGRRGFGERRAIEWQKCSHRTVGVAA